ncbi:unnamed protein product, partial [Polarella glacialis]
ESTGQEAASTFDKIGNFTMPRDTSDKNNNHREKLGISDQPFNAFVGRLLKNSEIKSDPAAQAAILSELGKFRAAGAWSESTVIEWSLVRDNAVRSGKKVHVGRLHAIATEKGSELPLGHPERKMKGRIVFLGNNVRDEDGQRPVTMEASRMCDAFGLLSGHAIEQADAEQAYIQSPLGGTETYIRLPKELQPDSWKHMRDPVCKLVMSLYGHPTQAVMMAVYVDDFKASGRVEALKKAWTLARSKIRTGVCGEDVVLKKASTPFLDEDKLPEEDDNEPGKLADAACSVLMKVLYGARLARLDLLKAVAGLASKVTKWSVSCDKRLFRLMCYINDSKGLKMRGYVGRDDKAEDLFLMLFAGADFAGCRDTARSTSGVFLGIYGKNAFVPVAAQAEKQSCVSHSTPEAELVAANLALRTQGLPALEVFDKVFGRKVKLFFEEDNNTAISTIKAGYSNTMRHLDKWVAALTMIGI